VVICAFADGGHAFCPLILLTAEHDHIGVDGIVFRAFADGGRAFCPLILLTAEHDYIGVDGMVFCAFTDGGRAACCGRECLAPGGQPTAVGGTPAHRETAGGLWVELGQQVCGVFVLCVCLVCMSCVLLPIQHTVKRTVGFGSSMASRWVWRQGYLFTCAPDCMPYHVVPAH